MACWTAKSCATRAFRLSSRACATETVRLSWRILAAAPPAPDDVPDRRLAEEDDDPPVVEAVPRLGGELVDELVVGAELAALVLTLAAAFWALSRLTSASARACLAWITAILRSVLSIRASSCPALTCCRSATLTLVTVPADGNPTEAWSVFCTVPLPSYVSVTSALVAVAVA